MSVPLTTENPVVPLELVATFSGAMPAGVAVSRAGRIFVNFPQWDEQAPATVTELRNRHCEPYPDRRWNSPGTDDDPRGFVSAQSVVVDTADRLWILDSGSPMFRPVVTGGPKLVCVDLTDDTVVETIVLGPEVAPPTAYLGDVRIDLRRGSGGLAFVTDATDKGPNAIVVVDLVSGAAWRRLEGHPSTRAEGPRTFRPVVEGRPFVERPVDGPARPVAVGADGLAISPDGSRLYYCPLASRHLYSVSIDALADPTLDDASVAATVVDEGDKGSGAAGLETDHLGRVYLTAYEHDAVLRRRTDGEYETVAHDPRLLWPDAMSVSSDGYLYVTANQLHRQARFQLGQDLRRKPYALFRLPIDGRPAG
ncbi:L-dopachrome tautomerase-related protein [Polymorphospora sp. NPDC051019]|uniref:L-dopachrome tautomerase-related protein n=1 Tax=Polymorphospora sp. NPDC051019 TaxID=3155725 RepID=UPI0034279229